MKKETLNVIILSSFMTLSTTLLCAQEKQKFVPKKIKDTVSKSNEPVNVKIDTSKTTEKTVHYYEDSRLTELQEMYNKKHEEGLIKGFRIELFSISGANSRAKAYEALLDFKEKYENTNAYVEWNEPNFEVEVGDYRSRLEAQKALKEFSSSYPFAFIKKTKIKLPNLEQQKKAEE